MNAPYRPMTAIEILDLYFIENRSRILDVAAFLDRIDRYEGADKAKADFRYVAIMKVIKLLAESGGNRTKSIQLALSDPTSEPLASAVGMKAWGAWQGDIHEGD